MTTDSPVPMKSNLDEETKAGGREWAMKRDGFGTGGRIDKLEDGSEVLLRKMPSNSLVTWRRCKLQTPRCNHYDRIRVRLEN